MIQTKKAFTLVELIVVIVILAILGTISFISLQNYSSSARDTKRINDIKSLLTKIEIEHIKGVSYSQLINSGNEDFNSTTGTGCHTGNVLGQPNIKICQGPANFTSINENRSSFLDPLSKKDKPIDYIFAYTSPVMIDVGNGKTETREFIQGGIINENGNAIIAGNYYQSNTEVEPKDAEGLILGDSGKLLVNGENGSITQNRGTISHNTANGEITIIYGGSTYIIEDKNLGAAEVYSGTEKAAVRGNHYQWGRNRGFSSTSALAPNTSQSAINADTKESNTNFIWDSSLSSNRRDWSITQEDHLWGDISTSNGIIIGSNQGPCDDIGRHVPTSVEWAGLVEVWCKYKGGTTCTGSSINWLDMGFTWSSDATEILQQFKTDLKLPTAGFRTWNPGTLLSQDSGYYWSSSPDGVDARALGITSSAVYPKDTVSNRAHGESVRCFKDQN